MNADRSIAIVLRLYICVVFIFVFAPIVASFIFSFNSDRFPTVPLGHFTLHWYETVYNDQDVWDALKVSVMTALAVSVISTFIGFCAAYTDFRYRFFGKNAYLALALLPPTIPLVIMGLAMLAWLSRIGMSGQIYSIMIAHVVMCTPFAMAIIRIRLAADGPEPRSRRLEPRRQRVARHVRRHRALRPARHRLRHVPDGGGLVRRVRRGLVRLRPQQVGSGDHP